MTEKRFELRLCNNGNYYLYCNGVLINSPSINFDKFNKEDAESIINELNHLLEENEQLKKENKELQQFIDDVWRKYENAHGLSIDNSDWF